MRIVADDLTGALDTAAQFTGLHGPLPVVFEPDVTPGSAAFDSGLREVPWESAKARMAALADFLSPGEMAYLKIDSLLRGHTILDLVHLLRLGLYRRCLVAPAFPAEGRITRRGVQFLCGDDDVWRPVGPSLIDGLADAGVTARLARSADEIESDGVIVCDAETQGDLAAIARAGERLGREADGRLLWCGTAGLARAMAGCDPMPWHDPPRPLLIIIGSIHPRSQAQVRGVEKADAGLLIEVGGTNTADPRRVSDLLARRGAAALHFRLSGALAAPDAMRRIRAALGQILPAIDPPGALFVSGGETLRAICDVLNTRKLVVSGELKPGFPAARLVGGIWDGMPVLSKSGAFGDASVLLRLMAAAAPAAAAWR